MNTPPRVILASTSKSRAAVLAKAGVVFAQESPGVDEDGTKAAQRAQRASTAKCAETLAEMKALAVSNRNLDALVIGGDQMLECDGTWFDKPVDRIGARTQLQALRGKRHRLINSLIVARAGQRLWHHADHADITMRNFTDAFLDNYLSQAGDGILRSVGGYELEGLGPQLMEKVEGDFFSILGLPLLPLLAVLREHGVLLK